ncbi:MAG: ThuA domain-containing protein [Verrucomicrobiales bacterium]|nr:ThuA domain-containing protein [Verrucomicrobiales bacterium]
MSRLTLVGGVSVLLLLGVIGSVAADRNLVLIAGKPSHGPLDHEFRAGSLLLQKCLAKVPGLHVEVHTNGWVNDPAVLDRADAVMIYADGGGGHPAIQGNHPELLKKLVQRGAGLAFAHYGVEVPATNGGALFHEWIGGYYEHLYSVNPMWKPEYTSFPHHSITRGVKAFAVTDEWYFNMRWRPDMKGVTPILVAKPSDKVRGGPYVYPPGPYEHIKAASGRDEVMMWAMQRADGGRGFGFTGGHRHLNWGDDNYRRVVLNALLWISRVEVPEGGVESSVTEDDLMQNLDPKTPRKPPVAPAKAAAK